MLQGPSTSGHPFLLLEVSRIHLPSLAPGAMSVGSLFVSSGGVATAVLPADSAALDRACYLY
jgi:hypothetical protein